MDNQNKKHKKNNLLSYITIIGGCALLSVLFLNLSRYENAKCKASKLTLNNAETQIKNAQRKLEKSTNSDEIEQLNDRILWFTDIRDHFDKVNKDNAVHYTLAAVPAYLFSALSLVAFGLVLKHADKAKEKEEQQ